MNDNARTKRITGCQPKKEKRSKEDNQEDGGTILFEGRAESLIGF